MTTDSLSATGLIRRLGGRAVVDGVTLALAPGAITALLGSSGAGKSTLLRLFAGLEPADAGEIRLGNDILTRPGWTLPAERRRIGLIFQDFALFPHLTALRNVTFGLAPQMRGEAETIASGWLARLGLSERAQAYPHELSGGEQQRVAIARALAPQPAAILMDEPFSGLDPSLRGPVRDLALDAVRSAGIPALMVTHDPAEAMQSADRIAIMREGRLLQCGPAEEVYLKPASADAAAALGPVNHVSAMSLPASLIPQKTPPGAAIVIRPEGIRLDTAGPAEARITARRLDGALVRLQLETAGVPLMALVPRAGAPAPGSIARISLDPDLTFIFHSGTV